MNEFRISHPSRWLAGLGALSLGSALAVQSFVGPPAALVSAADVNPAAVASAQDLSTAFRSASESVMPAVVTIRTEAAAPQMDDEHGMGNLPNGIPEDMMPYLKRFFGDNVPEMRQMPRGMMPHSQPSVGMGSGVIIDPSGLILTNNHVAGGGGKVMVQLHDGREFEAVEVKTDPQSDIAVVRIEGAGTLPAAKLGNSDELKIGDWVLAVGAPFGLQETVTAGIISAKSRGIGITERADFLQTDAAINPGNSGGPLVNLHGEVVGINTAISTSGGGNDGVGFAVPVNQARWVSDQLIKDGIVQRAYLGVNIQRLTSDLSKQLGLKSLEGALVSEVRAGSPAEKAGLKSGDVIVEFNGKKVENPHRLQNLVEQAPMSGEQSVVVLRGDEKMTVPVSLAPLPGDVAKSETAPAKPETKVEALGLEVSDLTAEVAEQLGFKDQTGVVITSVTAGSSAERAGLESGMVIARVGNKDVHNAEEFKTAVDGAHDNGLLMLVRTPQGSQFVVVK
jgi:serine protease Do